MCAEKHYSEIIFKCVNSTMWPIFNKKVTEKYNLWDYEQCMDALFLVDKVYYCGLNQKKKKKREKNAVQNVDARIIGCV